MVATKHHKNRIELLQGTLDLLILETLRWGPSHGYGISQALRAQSADVLCVDAGSLYPALHRLERQGLVRAEWAISENKQRTRVYRLTPAGRQRLAGERSKWEQLSAAIESVLNRTRPSES
ncbi:MAG TPA: PadR family transcriptional regulator [Vicinamibacterales bacterium]|nr:PadR family transcriptional regulator [Vicinamibacterales bacterium]